MAVVGRRELLARAALLALVAAPPAVFLPRVLLGEPRRAPAEPSPAWAHLVVVTTSAWDDPLAARDHPALERLELRATRAERALAPSPSRAATAASLWTGRFPTGHSVLANDDALPESAWTVAAAARRSGARTAAFLAEPFVSATRIGGFEEVEEHPALDAAALAARAARFLARRAGERVVLWLHLADAGAEGGEAAALAGALQDELELRGLLPETILVLGAFSRRAPPEAPVEERLAAPLWTVLPGGLFAGRRSRSHMSLADLAIVLVELLRIPPPNARAGELPLHSRREVALIALRGGTWTPWDLVQARGGDIYREGSRRLVVPRGGGELVAEELLPGGRRRPLRAPEREALVRQHASLAGYLASGAPPPRPAEVPPAWRGPDGW